MTELLPVLRCKNCAKPIPLPHPSLSEISPSLLAWPKDGKPRNFACLRCENVYPYKEEEVSHASHLFALDQSRNATAYPRFLVRCIRIGCEEQHCTSQAHVRITQEGEPLSIEGLVQKSSMWVLHGVECPAGHPIPKGSNPEECSESWDATH